MKHRDVELVMNEVRCLHTDASAQPDLEIKRTLAAAADRLERVAQRLTQTPAKPAKAP